MKISHLYTFVPIGEDPSSASSVEKVPVTSDHTNSKKSLGKARERLRMKMTDYAARNHWEVHNTVSMYTDPPWNTSLQFCKNIMLFDKIDTVTTKRTSNETYHIIECTDDEYSIQDLLEVLYNKNIEYVSENNEQDTVIYTQWFKKY